MKKIKKEDLENLYWDKGLTTREIAKKLGYNHHSTILRAMKRLGIKTRDKKYCDEKYLQKIAIKKSNSMLKDNDFDFSNSIKFWYWFGGLFDGEGSLTVCIRKEKKVYRVIPLLQIEMVNLDNFMNMIQSKLGGRLFVIKKHYINPRHQDTTQLQIFGLRRAVSLAKQLKPFLIIKKESCEKFLDICKLIEQKEHLNKNGFLKICKLRDQLNSRTKPQSYKDYKYFKKILKTNKINKGAWNRAIEGSNDRKS